MRKMELKFTKCSHVKRIKYCLVYTGPACFVGFGSVTSLQLKFLAHVNHLYQSLFLFESQLRRKWWIEKEMATCKTDFLLIAVSILSCSSGMIVCKHFNTVNFYHFEFSTPSRLWVDFWKCPSCCLFDTPWTNHWHLCCLLSCFTTFNSPFVA